MSIIAVGDTLLPVLILMVLLVSKIFLSNPARSYLLYSWQQNIVNELLEIKQTYVLYLNRGLQVFMLQN